MGLACKYGGRICDACMACYEDDYYYEDDREGEGFLCDSCGCDISRTNIKGYRIQGQTLCDSCIEDYALEV